MKNKMFALVAAASLLVGCSLLPGCMVSKVSTVTPPFTNSVTGAVTGATTNVVFVINTNNLTLDTIGIQGATVLAASITIQKYPSTLQAFQDAQEALDGVLNGSNPQTTQQVLALLGTNSNPAISSEITPLINDVSNLEQQLMARYGASVAGQINVAIAKAVDSGLIVALAGK